MTCAWGWFSPAARCAAAWMVTIAATGCGGGNGGTTERDSGMPSVVDPDGGPRADGGRGGDGGGPDAARPDGSTPDAGTPDGGPPPVEDLRFVVLGDTGEGNADQRAIGEQIRDLCAEEGCDFALLLGDNIYDSGVTSVDDPQWQTKFEEPYRDVDLPFYAVLGNHDYGGIFGSGDQWDRGPIEVDYTQHSEKWEMPATHYTLQLANVGFVMLDTNSLFHDDSRYGDQAEWYEGAVADLRADGAEWIIVAGHHPYLSNGSHGNAGNYDSRLIPNIITPSNGVHVKSFFDEFVCGSADVYFSGHDHNRQWIDEPDALCGTHMIVSGAGSKVTDFARTENETLFQDDETPGFMYVVIRGDTMTGRFIDMTGRVDFEHTITRTQR